MFIDSHLHVGQYYHIYTSPADLLRMMDRVGVDCFAVSSTSICEGDYGKVLNEMRELARIAEGRIFPVLWIVPDMLNDEGLERLLDCGIQWRCLKIHPQLHPFSWQAGGENLKSVVSLAKEMRLPILIHTGEIDGCFPHLFQEAIANNPSVTFILAHARPLDETIELMKAYKNVWTDTAFVPASNVVRLCKEGLSDRIIWGTDYPIPRYYFPEKDMKEYYKELVDDLKSAVSAEDYERITYKNFLRCCG